MAHAPAQPPPIDPGLARPAMVSAVLHALIIVALLVTLPSKPDEAPEETGFAVEFGPSQPTQRADKPAPVPAVAPAPVPTDEPPAPEAPKNQPLSVAPPPPPPPLPPPPTPSASASPAVAPPVPTEISPTPSTVPPPAAAPQPSQSAPLPVPPLPVPPPPVPVTTPPTPNAQPNPTKNPAPESRELENTLEKLRALVQKQAPKAKYNPAQGGAPNGGGNPNGSDTNALSADARRAIGDQVRECWTRDAGALDADKLRVHMIVQVDGDGVARKADVAPDDLGKMSNPVFRAFAERARRAVLDSRCAKFPLPPNMLGSNHTLDFRFSP